jgi:hypothetical protein
MIEPMNEEPKDDLIVFWQRNYLLIGLFELSHKCCPEELRMTGEKILVYDETLLFRAN